MIRIIRKDVEQALGKIELERLIISRETNRINKELRASREEINNIDYEIRNSEYTLIRDDIKREINEISEKLDINTK